MLKSPVFAGFFANFDSLKTRRPDLAGWRPSAVSTLLRLFSLLTGNFTGNFAKIAALAAWETIESAVITGLPMRIPYSTELGIIFVDQGILAREQGILSAGKVQTFIRRNCQILIDTLPQFCQSSGREPLRSTNRCPINSRLRLRQTHPPPRLPPQNGWERRCYPYALPPSASPQRTASPQLPGWPK